MAFLVLLSLPRNKNRWNSEEESPDMRLPSNFYHHSHDEDRLNGILSNCPRYDFEAVSENESRY